MKLNQKYQDMLILEKATDYYDDYIQSEELTHDEFLELLDDDYSKAKYFAIENSSYDFDRLCTSDQKRDIRLLINLSEQPTFTDTDDENVVCEYVYYIDNRNKVSSQKI